MSFEINKDALEVARKAVEERIIEMRDSGMFMLSNNGFVCNSFDGTPSSIIRLSTAFGLQLGIEAYMEALETCNEQ